MYGRTVGFELENEAQIVLFEKSEGSTFLIRPIDLLARAQPSQNGIVLYNRQFQQTRAMK